MTVVIGDENGGSRGGQPLAMLDAQSADAADQRPHHDAMTPLAQSVSHRGPSMGEGKVVVEERCGEYEAVGTVQRAAVARQEPPHILDPEIALHRRDRQSAEATEEAERGAD